MITAGQRILAAASAVAVMLIAACNRGPAPASTPAPRPSMLLVTLDTTRADAIGRRRRTPR